MFIKLNVGSPRLGELEGLQGTRGALSQQWRAWDWYRKLTTGENGDGSFKSFPLNISIWDKYSQTENNHHKWTKELKTSKHQKSWTCPEKEFIKNILNKEKECGTYYYHSLTFSEMVQSWTPANYHEPGLKKFRILKTTFPPHSPTCK